MKILKHYLVDGQGNVHPSVGQLLGNFLRTLGSEFFENPEIKEPSVSVFWKFFGIKNLNSDIFKNLKKNWHLLITKW
jgi:hypothetical protein